MTKTLHLDPSRGLGSTSGSNGEVASMARTDLKNLSRRDFGRLSGATRGGVLAGTSWATTHDKSSTPEVNGTVAPGFERVKDAFAANFKHHGDVGAAFSLYHHGKKVVDLWGGVVDEESGRP